MTDLDIDADRVALVFGGSRGIGAAIARQLARDGHVVAITFVSRPEKADETVAAIAAEGGKSFSIQADSADAEAVQRAVDETVARSGPLDVAVVNAGLYRGSTIGSLTLAELDLLLAVNVRGVVLAVQAAAAHMRGGGRIITIGSNTAIRTGVPGASIYSMTKAAVATFVKGAALDLAPSGITVNNIQPGPIATDITAGLADHLEGMIPIGRIGQPQEVADLVSYVASAKSGYMTGASLTIDGGFVL